jgi:hypothetical protein
MFCGYSQNVEHDNDVDICNPCTDRIQAGEQLTRIAREDSARPDACTEQRGGARTGAGRKAKPLSARNGAVRVTAFVSPQTRAALTAVCERFGLDIGTVLVLGVNTVERHAEDLGLTPVLRSKGGQP